MKVSLAWVKDLLSPAPQLAAVDAEAAARALTAVGLEVEGKEPIGRQVAGVVIAEVLGIRPHPGANKLRIVRVRAGSREEDVVCGAPNVPPPGNRVVWAPPGARLPGGITIAAKEVRGVLSPGMLCSEPELGIGDKGDGILILSPSDPGGADFAAHVGLADDILEVNVTPNRPDALSHLGIARELAAFLQVPLRPWSPPVLPVGPGPGPSMDVAIADPGACPRYQARFASGLAVAPSPLGMRLRLSACGVRPISNVVDVTNFVLLELGHPLHAFDFDTLSGAITVRRATAGEKLWTLDGTERVLEAGDIVIADAQGPVALAGVMGGAATEVSEKTTRVLLEAATFHPISVRKTSRRLGLLSEASYRFERHVDAEGIPRAAARAMELLCAWAGGKVVEGVVDRYPAPAPRRVARLPLARLRRVAGVALGAAEATRELSKISEEVTLEGEGQGEGATLVVAVPSYRPDVELPEDLVEEVLRLSGRYEAPAHIERVLTNAQPAPNPEAPGDRCRDLLAAAGLAEVATWGFVSRSALAALAAAEPGAHPELTQGVAVLNPISAEYEVMRTSLLPGLCEVLRRNLARGEVDVGLFEVGPVVFRPSAGGEPGQEERAGLLLSGRAPGWLRPGASFDFFDLKRVVERLCRGFGVEAEFQPGPKAAFLHPGVAAQVTNAAGTVLGLAGELHPVVGHRLGLEASAFYAEIDLWRLAGARPAVTSQPPPRFPAVSRDLSFWIDAKMSAGEQRKALFSAGEPLLRALFLLEDFRDPQYVPAGEKGMLWTMTYRADDRTLTDAEADAAHARVVAALGARLMIRIR